MDQLSYKLTALYMNKDFLKVVASTCWLIESNLLTKKKKKRKLLKCRMYIYAVTIRSVYIQRTREWQQGMRGRAVTEGATNTESRTVMTGNHSRLGVKEGLSRSDLSMCHVTST